MESRTSAMATRERVKVYVRQRPAVVAHDGSTSARSCCAPGVAAGVAHTMCSMCLCVSVVLKCNRVSFGLLCVCVHTGSVQVAKDGSLDAKQFVFDAFFDPTVQQQVVYETVAQPVVLVRVWTRVVSLWYSVILSLLSLCFSVSVCAILALVSHSVIPPFRLCASNRGWAHLRFFTQSVLEGYNGTIFAYGQTGTGKTHTMLGPPTAAAGTSGIGTGGAVLPTLAALRRVGPGAGADAGGGLRPSTASAAVDGDADADPLPAILAMGRESEDPSDGVIPRALADLFHTAHADTAHVYDISVSYVQIYCELIHDLLGPDPGTRTLNVREAPSGGVFVEGAARFKVDNPQACLELLLQGHQNRAQASTRINSHSSRSHAVFMVHVDRREVKQDNGASAGAGAGPVLDTGGAQLRRGTLFLVDLAGSERVKKSGATGVRFNEMKAINLSLAALGNCIGALASKRSHVPYRDSKLTRLLQDSLGGNAKTALVVTVTGDPQHFNETVSSLQFGSRAKQVQVCARVNEVVDYKELYQALQAKVDRGDDETTGLRITIQQLKATVSQLHDRLRKATQDRDAAQAEADAVKRALPEPGATSGGSGSAAASGAAPDAAKWQTELQQLREGHQRQLDAMREEMAHMVAKQRKGKEERAAKAAQLETDLGFSRDELLEALSAHRKAETQLLEVERESKTRIAELVVEVERLTEEDVARTEELAKTKTQLDRTQMTVQSIKDRIERDYVSREQVTEMEALYNDSIEKLMARVQSLEERGDSTALVPAGPGSSRRAGAPAAVVAPSRRRTAAAGTPATKVTSERRVRTQPDPRVSRGSRARPSRSSGNPRLGPTSDVYTASASSHLSSEQARQRERRAVQQAAAPVGRPPSGAQSSGIQWATRTPTAAMPPVASGHRSSTSAGAAATGMGAGVGGRSSGSSAARLPRVPSAGSDGGGSVSSGGGGGGGGGSSAAADELGMDLSEARSLLNSILAGSRS